MCFSLVFACLFVSLGAGSQESCPATLLTYTYLPAPLGEQNLD